MKVRGEAVAVAGLAAMVVLISACSCQAKATKKEDCESAGNVYAYAPAFPGDDEKGECQVVTIVVMTTAPEEVSSTEVAATEAPSDAPTPASSSPRPRSSSTTSPSSSAVGTTSTSVSAASSTSSAPSTTIRATTTTTDALPPTTVRSTTTTSDAPPPPTTTDAPAPSTTEVLATTSTSTTVF